MSQVKHSQSLLEMFADYIYCQAAWMKGFPVVFLLMSQNSLQKFSQQCSVPFWLKDARSKIINIYYRWYFELVLKKRKSSWRFLMFWILTDLIFHCNWPPVKNFVLLFLHHKNWFFDRSVYTFKVYFKEKKVNLGWSFENV